jgi:hypothetical protein
MASKTQKTKAGTIVPKVVFATTFAGVIPACILACSAGGTSNPTPYPSVATRSFVAEMGFDATPDRPLLTVAQIGFDAHADGDSDAAFDGSDGSGDG